MENSRPPKQKAFNPVPPIVVVLAMAMLGIELVLQAGEHGLIGGPRAEGWRLELMRHFGFHKAVFDHIVTGGDLEPKVIWPFLSYLFVSGDFLRTLISSVLVLAMGKLISDTFSSIAVVVLFLACGLIGAFTFGIFSAKDGFPLVGAFPVFYGFIGTYTWIRIFELYQKKENLLPAFYPIIMFAILRTAFALMYGVSNSWMADLAGLLTGFLLAYILAPDGKDRVKGWIRSLRNR